MNTIISYAIQLALFLIPLAALLAVKKKSASVPLRIGAAIALALVFSAIGYVLATQFGWRPVGNSGPVTEEEASSTVFFWFYTLVLSAIFVLVAFAKPEPKE
jgi:hypothetical protein